MSPKNRCGILVLYFGDYAVLNEGNKIYFTVEVLMHVCLGVLQVPILLELQEVCLIAGT
jgi:hypothetical protein